jgi:ferredoxin-thioredoxin reductase catalytic subunit
LNPDPERVKKVVGLMTANFEAVGEYICPCKQQNKPPVKGADTLCPCPEMGMEIEESGHCFCRLFVAPEVFDPGLAGA